MTGTSSLDPSGDQNIWVCSDNGDRSVGNAGSNPVDFSVPAPVDGQVVHHGPGVGVVGVRALEQAPALGTGRWDFGDAGTEHPCRPAALSPDSWLLCAPGSTGRSAARSGGG